jgi:hypothetical protein
VTERAARASLPRPSTIRPVPWDIDLEGDEQARRNLQRLLLALTDLRPFWPMIVPIFVGWMRRQFDTQGSFGGAPWAPLSPAYAAWKSLHYPGRGILYAEGDLRMAASKPRRTVTPRALTLTIDWAAEKGQPVDLAWHQAGTARMPARPLLFETLPTSARLDVEQAADKYVEDLVRRLGLG